MKRFLLLLSLPLILGLSTWAFMEGRKEMQKERDREKPVQTPPRVKKTSDGSVIIEFDKATYALSGIASQTSDGPLKTAAIVSADGQSWYYAETSPGIFQRKKCVEVQCPTKNETVVVQGAQLLLSEERKGKIKMGEGGE